MIANAYHVRFWTEAIEGTEALVSEVYQHYTLTTAQGIWQGNREATLLVDVVEEGETFTAAAVQRAQTLVDKLKEVNKQQTVMVTVHETVVRFM